MSMWFLVGRLLGLLPFRPLMPSSRVALKNVLYCIVCNLMNIHLEFGYIVRVIYFWPMQMVALLGVSKAVLENVIFCHQEESCW